MILVTGAAGFVGRHLVARLLADGEHVRALARTPESGARLRADLGHPDALDMAHGDVTDPAAVRAAADGCALVFHLAGGYRGSAAELRRVHVTGTSSLVAAVAGTDTRVVLLSSTSVYGWERAWPADERTAPAPVTAYGAAKLAAERLVLDLDAARGVVVRSTIVYGPGDTRGMIPRALRLLGRRLRVLPGSGANRVHLTHVDDVVSALLLAGRDGAGVYQVAGPGPASIARTLAVLAEGGGLRPPVFVGGRRVARRAARAAEGLWRALGRDGEPPLTAHAVDVVTRDRAYGAARARDELGWRPQVPLEEGLAASARSLSAPAAETGPEWRSYFDDPDEGLGTVYERFVLADVIDRALDATGSASVLHAPLFGMTGIPGLDTVFAARRGVPTGLLDVDPDRLDAVEKLWRDLGLAPATHLAPGMDPGAWPTDLGEHYDLVFSFAALWWFAEPAAVLRAQARWARRGVLVAVPNPTVFMALRRRTWHRDMFDHLNASALDPAVLHAAGRAVGLRVADEGWFDLPPFPDTAFPLARALRRGDSEAEGALWSWSILPHLQGREPDLPDRVRWVGVVERRAPRWLSARLAHHRYVLFVPDA